MSWFRNLLAFFVAITAFAIGSVAANYALQLTALLQSADPTPEATKVAELVSKGPGTKVYVELTDFKFGEPLIDKTRERWDCVWVPLLPTSGKSSAPAVFFRSTRIRNQAQFDELRGQKSLRVFVVNSALKRSVWGASGVSSDLYMKYPKLDFDKLTLVAEPDLEAPYSQQLTGKTISFSTETLFAETSKNMAWGVAGGAFVLGIVLVVLMITPLHGVKVTDARCLHNRSETGTSVPERHISSIPRRYVTPEDVKSYRERLATENPGASHHYRAMGMITTTVGIGLGLLAFVGIFGAFVYGTSRAGETGPLAAAGVGVFAASVFMFLVYFCKRSLDLAGKFADVIQICASGIRWQIGKQVRMAAWPEIAHIERVTLDVNMRKQVMASQFGLVGALAASMGSAGEPSQLTRQSDRVFLQLQSGEVMYFSKDTLSDYVAFAEAMHQMHGNEARRFEGGAGPGMLGRAFSVPGAPSRFTMFNNNR